MSSCGGLIIPLQSIHIIDRKLRYFTIGAELQTIITNGDMQKDTPLFLAADVLSATAISPDNQPRIHARYGKQGLASKLSFPPGAKISGMHGVGRGVWFYSVLGAMKVTFEFLGIEQQVAMMDSLQDVWRQRAKDPPLPTCVTILHFRGCLNDNGGTNLGSCGLERNRTGITDDIKSTDSTKEAKMKRSHTIVLGNSEPKRKMTAEKFKEIDSSVKNDNNCDYVTTGDTVMSRNDDLERRILGDFQEGSSTIQTDSEFVGGSILKLRVHHVEEISTDEEPTQPKLNQELGGGHPCSSREADQTDMELIAPARETEHQCWCKHIRKLSEESNRDERRNLVLQLGSLVQKISSAFLEISNNEVQTCIDLLECILCALSDASEAPIQENMDTVTGGEEPKGQRITEAVAVWLGSKFYSEVTAVSKRVEDFKLRNIDQINSLPQPERLVHVLFPRAMVDFVMAWTGSGKRQEMVTKSRGDHLSCSTHENYAVDANDGSVQSVITSDSGGQSESQRADTSGANESEANACFPLVQFILELANQTLVSGMAHVIYPRLIQNAAM